MVTGSSHETGISIWANTASLECQGHLWQATGDTNPALQEQMQCFPQILFSAIIYLVHDDVSPCKHASVWTMTKL